MTRPPQRLKDSLDVERVTPKRATELLIHGLLPPDEAETFRPVKLSVPSIVEMLRRANEVRNRTVTFDTVAKYARDMSSNNWLWTGEPIQLDPDGFVRNGQHRLLAIIESGKPQDLLVVRDVEVRAQLVMDSGRPRRIPQQVHMAGVANAPRVTAIANVLLRWRSGKMMNTYQSSMMEVSVIINTEPIDDAIRFIHRLTTAIDHVPQGSIGAAFIEAGHVDPVARDEFFNPLVTGANLAAGDPRLTLRNTMSRQLSTQVRFRRTGQLYQIVHAWNLWRRGELIQILRIPSTLTSNTFPVMK